jgi:hypothetical protein
VALAPNERIAIDIDRGAHRRKIQASQRTRALAPGETRVGERPFAWRIRGRASSRCELRE